MSGDKSRAIDNIQPILCVKDMEASVAYCENVLGFKKAGWGDTCTYVSKDGWGVYLCEGAQGMPGTWVWVGVYDVDTLFEQFRQKGAKIVLPPTNYPHALEIRVEDSDGHVLRFGSGPRENEPFEAMEH